MPDIYLDLDGVLVDLDKGYRDVSGYTFLCPECPSGDAKWDAAKNVDEFWYNLPMMEDANDLIAYVLNCAPNHKVKILSAPQHLFPTCEDEKRRWVAEREIIPNDAVHIVPRKDKPLFAVSENGVPNILIDDYIKNINEWVLQGGIGILHTSAQSTIDQLQGVYPAVKAA